MWFWLCRCAFVSSDPIITNHYVARVLLSQWEWKQRFRGVLMPFWCGHFRGWNPFWGVVPQHRSAQFYTSLNQHRTKNSQHPHKENHLPKLPIEGVISATILVRREESILSYDCRNPSYPLPELFFQELRASKFVGAEPFIMSVSFLGGLPFLGGIVGWWELRDMLFFPPGENSLQSRRSYQQGWGWIDCWLSLERLAGQQVVLVFRWW